ncbi:MAG: ribose-5-phosphate isomerase RpiA [Myxococcota bacterium]
MDTSEAPYVEAAHRAALLVESDMRLGLGTGRAATAFIEAVAGRYARGELTGLRCVPSSRRTEALARELGLPLAPWTEGLALDLTVDGADEVDPQNRVLKGAGGALLLEKVIAAASRRWVLVIDASKQVERLGTHFPLPVEVVREAAAYVRAELDSLGRAEIRKQDAGADFVTDTGHLLLDLRIGPMDAPEAVAHRLGQVAGVVEHGLFLGAKPEVLVGA